MNCPVCKVPLIAVERDQIEVDYCMNCRGLWFDRGELDLLGERFGVELELNTQPKAASSHPGEKPRDCPRCAKKMEKGEMSAGRGIVIDRCPSGEGIWFDARELGSLLDRLTEAAGASRPVASFLGEVFGRKG